MKLHISREVKEIKAKARVNERRADTDEAAPMALELGSFPSEATPSSGSTTAFVFDTTPTVGEKRGQEELGVLGEEVPVAPAAKKTSVRVAFSLQPPFPSSSSFSPSLSSSSSASILPQQGNALLRLRVAAGMKLLMSASKQRMYQADLSSGEHAGVEAPCGREEEHHALVTLVEGALSTARGAVAYVCGMPGSGKTQTVVCAMEAINARRQNAILGGNDMGYRVVWLCGSALRSRKDVFHMIAYQTSTVDE